MKTAKEILEELFADGVEYAEGARIEAPVTAIVMAMEKYANQYTWGGTPDPAKSGVGSREG